MYKYMGGLNHKPFQYDNLVLIFIHLVYVKLDIIMSMTVETLHVKFKETNKYH